MNKLIDKAAVLLLCIAAFSFSEEPWAPVAGLLMSAAETALQWLYAGSAVSYGSILVFSAMCLPFPVLLCAAPIMLYDASCEKKPWLAAPALLGLTDLSGFTSGQLVVITVSLAVTVIFAVRLNSLEKTVDTLSSLRDEVEEKNLLLKEKNLSLADSQDNEVNLATLRERNRIAREIHDNVGHMLTRSLLQAGALNIINKDEQLRQPLAELKDTLNTAMTSIRESVHDLHDESVDLDAAVRESIRSVDSRFRVSFDNDSEGELPVKLRLCFIAVIKEGLSNAVRHSDGDRIMITLRQHPAFYQLTVEDNGSCPERLPAGSGIGLQNMRDRAEALGGTISFTPSADGFKIFMTVPTER